MTPASDDYLHLGFHPSSREEPFLNALEIVPGIPGKLRPIRLVARDTSCKRSEFPSLELLGTGRKRLKMSTGIVEDAQGLLRKVEDRLHPSCKWFVEK